MPKTITTATDSTVSRAVAHLRGAIEHADARARLDDDELLSSWATVACTISLAAAGLELHLDGPVLPAEHPDCLSALRAASHELAGVRADIDLPLLDFADVLAHVSDATRHVQGLDGPDGSATAEGGSS